MKKISILFVLVLTFLSACRVSDGRSTNDMVEKNEAPGVQPTEITPTTQPTFTPTATLTPTPTATPTPVPINLKNAGQLEVLKVIQAHPSGQVLTMDISPDGKQLITGSTDYSTRIIDLERGTIEKVFYMAPVGTNGVAFTPNGEFHVSGHGYGDVWRIKNLDREQTMAAILSIDPMTDDGKETKPNTFLSVGKQAYVPDMTDIDLQIDPEGNTDLIRPINMVNVVGLRFDEQDMDLWQQAVQSPKFPDEWKKFAETPLETPVWLWHISYDNNLPPEFEATRNRAYASVDSIAASPVDGLYAFGIIHGDVDIVDANDQTKTIVFPANREGLYKKTYTITFSPDGKWIATGGDYPLVRIWDSKTGELLQKLSGHSNWIFDLAFSPDGSKLASVGYDNLIYIWDTQTWKYTQFIQHQYALTAAFSKDGKVLFAGGRGPTLVVWDIETGEALQKLDLKSTILSMKLLPSGDQLAVGTMDGNITILGIP